MKYLDLFSGYGGFSLGIQQAYEEVLSDTEGKEFSTKDNRNSNNPINFVPTKQNNRPSCIGFSEIDKYAIQIYKKHFPYEECEQCRNNRTLGNGQQLATQTDLQQKETIPVSPSGVGNGRGKLPVNNCKCKHKSYGDITKLDPSTLPDFDLLTGGFPCQAFSIAGKRGGFEDTRGTLIFDVFRILKEKQPRLVLLENVKGLLSHDSGRTFKTILTTLNELGYAVEWQVLNAKNFGVPQNRERVFIIGHLGEFGGRQVFPIGGDDEIHHIENTETESGAKHTFSTIATNTKRKESNYVASDYKIRRLTPIECERLMGLPDGWTEGVSDTQRYKMAGNGVVVNVVKEIIKRLKRA